MSTDSYRKCAKCGATPIQDGTVSFHRFPKPGVTNILRARAWAKYCWPEQDWLSVDELTLLFKSNKVLCKRHFEDSCFTDSTKTSLGRFSVPGDKIYVATLMEILKKDMPLMRHNVQRTSTSSAQCLKQNMPSLSECQPGPSTSSAVEHQTVEARGSSTSSSQCLKQHMPSLSECQPGPSTSSAVEHQTVEARGSSTSSSQCLKQHMPSLSECQPGPSTSSAVEHQTVEARGSSTSSSQCLKQHMPSLSECQPGPSTSSAVEHQTVEARGSSTSSSQCLKQHMSSLSECQPGPSTSSAVEHQTVEARELLNQPTQIVTDRLKQSDARKITANRSSKKKNSILRELDIKKVSELTPRKNRLYKICSQRIKEINRLRKQLKFKRKCDKIQKICEDENVNKLHEMKLSNTFIILLQSQLQNCKKKLKARRYSIDQKVMALTLYKKSPACYRLLRRMFALPCQSTLKKMFNRIPLRPGINLQTFEGLKHMASKQLPDENICIMSFDEISIRKHLIYNEKLDLIEGFQDHANHGRTREIASSALVFMLAGIRKKWKQPIAFYFSGKTVTSDRLYVIIKEVLHECFKTGLNVVATVCDLSRVNIKALENLGSSKEKPYFTHEGHEIVTILDPPHLLKCTRNMLLTYNIEYTTDLQADGKPVKGIAKWSHIQQFYNSDKTNPNFVFAPALTEQHLNPNSKQKMRVKLAAQVFSHSVAAGILAKVASGELPAEAHATATLLSNFDQLFDALNADSPDLRSGKKYSTNITAKSPHPELFMKMKKFISEMKFIGPKTPPPSQFGWIQTINAVERLWNNLSKINIKSLSTRRLNQDPLENCFGCIRYHCGSNDNPNAEQFIAGMKTAIISNLRHGGSKKNCEDDTAVLCNNLKHFLLPNECLEENPQEKILSTDNTTHIQGIENMIADATLAIEQASSEAQACTYVCGFIFKKMRSKECDSCRKVCLIPDEMTNIHSFTNFKEYDTTHESLKYVNRSFVGCIEVCSSVINLILQKEAWKSNLKQRAMSALSQVNFDFLNGCSMHLVQNENHLKISAFYICLKRYITLKNREFSEEEKAKSMERKMRILKNK